MRLRDLLAAAILRGAAASASTPQWTPDEDIVGHIEKQPDHKVFVAALKVSGLRELLKGPGRFTVLAPNDAAFSQLPKGMMTALLAPAHRAQLRQLIGCHIVAHEIKFRAFGIIDPKPVMTVGGCALRFSRKNGEVLVADENGIIANLTRFDVFEANGQFEELDGVLTPGLGTIVKALSR